MKFTKILLLLNIFTLQSYLIRFKIETYSSNLQEILLLALAITFVIEVILNKNPAQTIKNALYKKVILTFLTLTIVSTIVNVASHNILSNIDLLRYFKFLLGAIAFTFIFKETLKKEKTIKETLKWGIYGALTFSIFALIYNLTGHNVALDHRLRGPLDSAVYLAYYISPFLITQIYFTLKKKTKKNLTITALLILALIATKSMGAIAATFAITILMLIKTSNKTVNNNFIQKRSLKIALTIIGIIIITFIINMKIIPTLKTDYSSLDERGQIWKTAIYTLKTHPKIILTGAAPAQFEAHYKQDADTALKHKPLDYNVIQPHNIFLITIYNYGIAGLIALLFIIFTITKETFSTNTKNNKSEIHEITFYIIIYFLIHGLIDTPIFKNDILIILILALSLYFTPQNSNKNVLK